MRALLFACAARRRCRHEASATPASACAPYNDEQVYRLRGYVGYQIDLEFEPGETFVGSGAGDLEGLTFVRPEPIICS